MVIGALPGANLQRLEAGGAIFVEHLVPVPAIAVNEDSLNCGPALFGGGAERRLARKLVGIVESNHRFGMNPPVEGTIMDALKVSFVT
jgi:hypothetical protein